MIDSLEDPFPELAIGEVLSSLSSLVNHWVFQDVLIIYILFEQVREQTLPTGEESIIEC